MSNKSVKQVFMFLVIVGLLVLSLVAGGLFFLDFSLNDKSEDRSTSSVYGEWVAVSGLCNGTLKNKVEGLDIELGALLKNGAKTSFNSIEVENRDLVTESCSLGAANYDLKVKFSPLPDSFLVGSINDFPVIKSASGVVYFKMSNNFKALYDSMQK